MVQKKATLKDSFIEALQNYKKRNFERAEVLCNKILSENMFQEALS